MGKGVLLDNGKKAKSSMALYWKAAQNKTPADKAAKKEVKEEDMETRASGNHDKWKIHKEKMINKMYEKIEKKEDNNQQLEKQKYKKEEEQL